MRMTLARREDAPIIADMSRRLIEQGLPWSWDERRVVQCIANRDCIVLTAREQRRVIGFAIMHFYDDHAHLSLLAVQPGCRRRGVGRELVSWLESSARVAGTFMIHLELRLGNRHAYAFYRKLGYSETGVRKAYYAGREDAIRMTRDLTTASARPSGGTWQSDAG
jgi:ribosomal-protein-alanine acetyltransferase